MRYLGLLLLAIALPAFGQGGPHRPSSGGGGIAASCSSCNLVDNTLTLSATGNALLLPTNGNVCLDGSSCTAKLWWDTNYLKIAAGTSGVFVSGLFSTNTSVQAATGRNDQLTLDTGANVATITASGNDSNIDISLVPKGTGAVTTAKKISSTVASGSDGFSLAAGAKMDFGGFRLWLNGVTLTTDGNFTVGGNNVTAGTLITTAASASHATESTKGSLLCLDGNTCAASVKAGASDDNMLFTSGSGDGDRAFIFDTTNDITNNVIIEVRRHGSGNVIYTLDRNGTVTAGNNVVAGALGSVRARTNNPVPSCHSSNCGSSTEQGYERGTVTASSNSAAVTFGTAFSAAPFCQCTPIDTAGTHTCTMNAAATTSGVTFKTSGASDVIHWFCTGNY